MRNALLGVTAVITLLVGLSFAFQKQIGFWLFERAVASTLGQDRLSELGEGLHVGLCGTGSPLPNLDRAGPCNVVIAGDQVFVVDIGEGGNEVLNIMGISSADLDGVLLTHFHSDHIDGMGPLMLFHWTRGASTGPLPVYGPTGVTAVIDGFNAAYAIDETYRVAHHGEVVVPPTGGGGVARPFEMDGETFTVIESDGLTVTAFEVEHDPVEPAVGYRFDYQGRSLCISGDTAKSSNLEAVCEGVDLIIHDALQPAMVKELQATMEAQGNANAATIFHDIQDYHASPEEAAESAQNAGAKMLVLSHLVPPLPLDYLYPAFLGDSHDRFDGSIVVGEDGMMFTLRPSSDTIEQTRLM